MVMQINYVRSNINLFDSWKLVHGEYLVEKNTVNKHIILLHEYVTAYYTSSLYVYNYAAVMYSQQIRKLIVEE